MEEKFLSENIVIKASLTMLSVVNCAVFFLHSPACVEVFVPVAENKHDV